MAGCQNRRVGTHSISEPRCEQNLGACVGSLNVPETGVLTGLLEPPSGLPPHGLSLL